MAYLKNEEVCPMRFQFRKMMDFCKVLLIFLSLTVFFYGLILWVGDRVEQNQRFENPKGKAIKVFYSIDQPTMSTFDDYKKRLFLYYWFGE